MDNRFFHTQVGNWEYVVRGNIVTTYYFGKYRSEMVCTSYEEAVDNAVRFATL